MNEQKLTRLIGNKRNLVINTLVSGKTGENEVEEFNKRCGC